MYGVTMMELSVLQHHHRKTVGELFLPLPLLPLLVIVSHPIARGFPQSNTGVLGLLSEIVYRHYCVM